LQTLLKPLTDMLYKRILEYYLEGFNDELYGRYISINNDICTTAYKLGHSHALIGDDVTSVDNLSDKELLKLIFDTHIKTID